MLLKNASAGAYGFVKYRLHRELVCLPKPVRVANIRKD